jgi:hypothetical protein
MRNVTFLSGKHSQTLTLLDHLLEQSQLSNLEIAISSEHMLQTCTHLVSCKSPEGCPNLP